MSRLFSPDRSRSAALTLAFLLILCGSLTLRPAAAVPTPTKLYELNGTNGSLPYGDLLYDAASRAYYGMTSAGGSSGKGMVFKLKADGTFDDLHDFTGGSDDGSNPNGSFVLSDTTLYGMTSHGGTSNYGVVFKISTNGTGFTVLHSFTATDDSGNNADGGSPQGSLVLGNSTLYGMTKYGGSSGKGVVFRMSASGTGFVVLHSFTNDSDGSRPCGSLVLNGSSLYGMASGDSPSGKGVVFSLPAAGGTITTLHSFTGGSE